MTCIAGMIQEGRATLMADTLASSTHLAVSCHPHKLYRSGPALVGVTGGVRIAYLLRYQGPVIALGEDGPVPSLLCWIDKARGLLRSAGVIRVKDSIEELTDSRLLIALDGRLFEVDSEWQLIEPRGTFWAVGSGQAYALGALDALEQAAMPLEPRELLIMALTAAARFDPNVASPYEILVGP